MRAINRALAAVAAAALLPAAAFTANLSDLWFDPDAPGWGMNLVQQDGVAFVTLFVHGPDGEPTWYVAPAAEAFAYSSDGLPHFRGTLYRVRGPWFAGPFDPSSVVTTPVGELSIEPLDGPRLRVGYRVADRAVVKSVVRQTWRIAAPVSQYDARFLVQRTDAQGSVSRIAYSASTLFELEEGAGTMTVSEPAGRCTYHGGYVQSGRQGTLTGQFWCEDGRAGPFTLRDLEFSAHGFSARIQASWNGGSLNGRVGGPWR